MSLSLSLSRYFRDGKDKALEECEGKVQALTEQVKAKNSAKKELEEKINVLTKELANAKVGPLHGSFYSDQPCSLLLLSTPLPPPFPPPINLSLLPSSSGQPYSLLRSTSLSSLPPPINPSPSSCQPCSLLRSNLFVSRTRSGSWRTTCS